MYEDESECYHEMAICAEDVIRMSSKKIDKDALMANYGVDVCGQCGANLKHMEAVRWGAIKFLVDQGE